MSTLLKIGGKLYPIAQPEDLELGDVLRFEVQTREFGYPLTIADVIRARGEVAGLDVDEAAEHPLSPILTAATVWICRRCAGEDVTFAEAIAVPLSEIDTVAGPEDHAPKAKKAKPKPSQPTTDSEAVYDPEVP